MPDRVLFVLCTILIWCKWRPARRYSTEYSNSYDNLITSEVFSLVCPSSRWGFSNSCLWNLCSFGLGYYIDWVRQRLDIFSDHTNNNMSSWTLAPLSGHLLLRFGTAMTQNAFNAAVLGICILRTVSVTFVRRSYCLVEVLGVQTLSAQSVGSVERFIFLFT